MINQDFILLIMNCTKYEKKAKFQTQTWLKTIPSNLCFYHVIGDSTLETDYKFNNEKNILWVKVNDDYNSLPNKVISSYQAINNTYNFKYIFKTDDDQILTTPKFFESLSSEIPQMIPSPHYGGLIVNIKTPYLSQYYKIHPELPKNLPLFVTKYCSGRFYFLSKLAIVDLINKREQIIKEYFEDYAIGYNLDDQLKKNVLNILTSDYFKDMNFSDYSSC
jgi:hypothetical protein